MTTRLPVAAESRFVPHPVARNYLGAAAVTGLAIAMLLGIELTKSGNSNPELTTPVAYLVSAVFAMTALAAIIAIAYRASRPSVPPLQHQAETTSADPFFGVLAPFSKPETEFEVALRQEQGAHIFNQLALMMVFTGANAVAVALALWGTVDGLNLVLWVAGALTMSILGFIASRKAPNLLAGRPISKRTLRRSTLHAGLRGLIWGLAFALFFAETGTTGRLILVSVACGMVAGGSPALAAIPSAALAYGLGIMVPTILRLLTMSGFDYSLIAALGITFSGSLVLIVCQMYRNFAGSLIQRRQEAEQAAVISLLLHEFEASASDWLWETDAAGHLTRFPERMASHLGLTHNDSAPILPLALAGADAEARAEILRQIENRQPFRAIETAVRRPDGGLVWISLTASPKPEGGYRGVGSNITDLKTKEAEIAAQSRRLAASNEELKQFATVASHDLQEPLRKIEAFGQRLKSRTAGKLDDDCQMYLNRMMASTARMRALITDLLAYSRATRQTVDFSPVDLDQLFAGVIDDLSVAIEEKKATVTVAPLGSISGNDTQLRQLFQNLLSNALKFSKPGRPPIITVERIIGNDGANEFRIRDNGIGFDMVHKDKIFEIFQRLHGRDAYEGTGVGLATCRKIVELHGGSIEVESTPGEGTLFSFTLGAKAKAAPTHGSSSSPGIAA